MKSSYDISTEAINQQTLNENQQEHIKFLESQNAELQQQLRSYSLDLIHKDALNERQFHQSIEINEKLEQEIILVKQKLKLNEMECAAAISRLVTQLETVSLQLYNTTEQLKDSDDQKQKLQQEWFLEKQDLLEECKENNLLMKELYNRIKELESENKMLHIQMDKKEAVNNNQSKELEFVYSKYQELQTILVALHETDQKFKNSSIESSCSQTEDDPLIDDSLPGKRLIMTDEGWEWTPWLYRAKDMVVKVDLNGLKNELLELGEHRVEALARTRNQTLNLLSRLTKLFPWS